MHEGGNMSKNTQKSDFCAFKFGFVFGVFKLIPVDYRRLKPIQALL